MVLTRFLLLFFLFCSLPSKAKSNIQFNEEELEYLSNNPTLVINTESHWPPYNYIEYGEVKGYSNDFIRLLATKIGLDVKFEVGLSWAQSLAKLQENKIDIISNLRKTAQREKYISFSERSISNTRDAILFKSTYAGLDFKDYLNGRVIAVVEGYSHQEILAQHYPGINILLASDSLESIELVLNGKADAAIGSSAVFHYYISKYFFSSLETRSLVSQDFFNNTPNFLGVSSNNPILINIIDKGISVISPEEFSELENKWLTNQIPDWSQTELQYTQAEAEYLLTKDNLKFCTYPDWMPISGIKNGKATGITGDFMQLLQQKLNIPFELVATTGWRNALFKINSRECDIIAPIEADLERLTTLNFSRPFLISDIVITTSAEQRFIPNFNNLRDVKIGIIRGYSLSTMVPSAHPSIEFVFVDSLKDGLEKVKSGQLFGFIDSIEVISYALQHHFPSLVISGKVDNSKWSLSIGTRNDEPVLKNIIEKALDNISTTEQRNIVNSWLSVRYTSPYNVKLFKRLSFVVFSILAFLLYRQKVLKEYNKKLKALSTFDSLTQLYNRRVIDTHLSKQKELAHRNAFPLSIIICDIDHFKHINDNFGHLVGDEVIIDLAAQLLENIRKSDIVGRWGGEEFLIICPNTKAEGAEILANNLRIIIENMPSKNEHKVTMSFGIAQFKQGYSCEELLIKADAALYSAKEQGRNKAVIG